jgi:hypothetical protein
MKSTEEKVIDNEEKVQYSDSTSEGEIRSDGDCEPTEEIVDLTTKYPPCIRAILLSYVEPENDEGIDHTDDNFEQQLGSLFLIPYTGGSIGRSLKNLISFPKNRNVSETHAFVSYDTEKKAYFIRGRLKYINKKPKLKYKNKFI